jgi:hypothetical protein
MISAKLHLTFIGLKAECGRSIATGRRWKHEHYTVETN